MTEALLFLYLATGQTYIQKEAAKRRKGSDAQTVVLQTLVGQTTNRGPHKIVCVDV